MSTITCITTADGVVVTTSMEVSNKFDRTHFHILRDINALKKNGCSSEFFEANFFLHYREVDLSQKSAAALAAVDASRFGCNEIDEISEEWEAVENDEGVAGNSAQTLAAVDASKSEGKPTRRSPYYLITKDGFSLLAMGFTGRKAMEWKERYIGEFNRMAEEIQQLRIEKALAEANAALTKAKEALLLPFNRLSKADQIAVLRHKYKAACEEIDAREAPIPFHSAVVYKALAELLVKIIQEMKYPGSQRGNVKKYIKNWSDFEVGAEKFFDKQKRPGLVEYLLYCRLPELENVSREKVSRGTKINSGMTLDDLYAYAKELRREIWALEGVAPNRKDTMSISDDVAKHLLN